MRKRVDHDATQEVSSSQLVPPAKPPALGNMPKNDASMWMSAPVSADDFVGAAKKKKKPAGSRGRGLVIGATVVALLAMTAGGVWYSFLRESPKQTSALETKPAADPAPAPAPPSAPAVAASASDAGVAAAAPDAALAAAPADPAAGVAGLQVDAVSAADPVVKKAPKKRAPTKKKVVKKKTGSKRR